MGGDRKGRVVQIGGARHRVGSSRPVSLARLPCWLGCKRRGRRGDTGSCDAGWCGRRRAVRSLYGDGSSGGSKRRLPKQSNPTSRPIGRPQRGATQATQPFEVVHYDGRSRALTRGEDQAAVGALRSAADRRAALCAAIRSLCLREPFLGQYLLARAPVEVGDQTCVISSTRCATWQASLAARCKQARCRQVTRSTSE